MNVLNQIITDKYALYHGDCIEVMRALPEGKMHFSIFSPPFSGLYIYSDSERDLGNSKSDAEFIEHYKFVAAELFRITMPGRLCAVHCKDLPKYFGRDEATGLKDFPGWLIKTHEDCGWTYHSRFTIWKCPVIERERTNNNGLLHKTIMRDRSQSRQGMADYIVVFRKVCGELMSEVPVASERGLTEYIGTKGCDPRKPNSFHPSPYSRKTIADNDSINIWRRYAEPVWWDIDQMDVLNYKVARDGKDEKHICPLQLGVIERAIQLWSNPLETVFSPFAGIGSEGYGALQLSRKFVGVELKESYFRQASENLKAAEREQQTLSFQQA